MVRNITLKYAGYCQDCSAPLPVGSKAKWYGRGKVYGIGCHAASPKTKSAKSNTWMSIEPDKEGMGTFHVFKWGIWERGSLLAGQQKKSYWDTFETVKDALRFYPKAEVSEWVIDAHNTFDHLPDEDDPISDAERFERAYMVDAYVSADGRM